MMIHALKDKVREAYFLVDPDELEELTLGGAQIINSQNNSNHNSKMDMETVILELKKNGRWILRISDMEKD